MADPARRTTETIESFFIVSGSVDSSASVPREHMFASGPDPISALIPRRPAREIRLGAQLATSPASTPSGGGHEAPAGEPTAMTLPTSSNAARSNPSRAFALVAATC